MNVDLVIHAPGAQGLARAALPWLGYAHYGDSAAALLPAVQRQIRQQDGMQKLRILDAFGPNPNHPLQDPVLLKQLADLLSPSGTVTLIILDVHPQQAQGFGGFSGPLSGSKAGIAASGFSGGFGGGFSGITARSFGQSPPHLFVARAAFGSRLTVETAASLADLRRNWGFR